MQTLQNSATEFLTELTAKGFRPARRDDLAGNRLLDLKNAEGHIEVRVCIDYEGEARPHSLSLIRFDGARSQMEAWRANFGARMPLTIILGAISAA